MRKTIDTIHPYKGYFGCASVCRIRVYTEAGQLPVIFATELGNNEGMSVTNMVERLAIEWTRGEATGELQEIIWIEHYPAERLTKETFALVTFGRSICGDITNPTWQPPTKTEVEALIGVEI